MLARPALANDPLAWDASDCLPLVEDRCRQMITASCDAESRTHHEVAAACIHHLQAGGSRIRARLALDAATHLGLDIRTAVTLATTCELLHNASLIHDDLQDRDEHRRGKQTVWKCFGADVAICAGDLLLSSAYAALAELDAPAQFASMMKTIHLRTATAIHGQAADIGHRASPVDTIDAYLRIVSGKSGALLSLPLELALLAAGNAAACGAARAAAESFAIGYQIADDLDDLEKDAGLDGRAATLNLALLLQRNGCAKDADHGENRHALARPLGSLALDPTLHGKCIALARQHLATAARLAHALPRRSGSLLAQLAVELDNRL